MVRSAASCRLEKITWRGFDAVMLENGMLRCTVVPALGGKIASLVHLPTMREWMWRNPALEPKVPDYGASYVAAHDLGGFDECFPSVAATRFPGGPWDGTEIPDHGEVWSLPWKADTHCDGSQIEVRLHTHGVRFPYRFERSLWMVGGEPSLRLTYNVVNLSPYPFPFIWSSHPVFNITPGMKVILPSREMMVYGSAQDRFGRLGRSVPWPLVNDVDGRQWDLSVVPDTATGLAVKLWGKAPNLGYVALQDIFLGSELRMQFDPTEVTHMGLWLNFGGWSGVPGVSPYFNLAIEPCIGAQDDLALAVRHYREYAMLPPQGRKAWQLELKLS
ncbi:MAG: hypothetical protein VKP62_07465 [Candidatus Sericytochromatia bacterium]|nr:hypothetical protein [Candidatus Sericytochromatia bacterium]